MNDQPKENEQAIGDDVSDEQLQYLIKEKKDLGAINVHVETDANGKRTLYWTWPPV